jgi:aconitate hydratase
MGNTQLDSFNTHAQLTVAGKTYAYRSLPRLAEHFPPIRHLPYSLRILLENLLRRENDVTVRKADIEALTRWEPAATPSREILFMPARVLLQDFTGVPALADLAAMRAAVKRLGGDPEKINPFTPADLVIDHSIQVDQYGSAGALRANSDLEFDRNQERYQFLRWGQKAFDNFHVVPPDSGIVHQVNLEYLAQVTITRQIDGVDWAFPDTLIGTDSHTTMINGLGILGWGVGGIEAEAALLNQPSALLIPQVIGLRLTGRLGGGATATDLVLTVTQLLRQKGVVGKFVEFFGPGVGQLSLADRATIANMAPEYGATVGLFPVDDQSTAYLRLTGRAEHAELTEAYYRAQGLWYGPDHPEPHYSDILTLDLGDVETSLAGPSRPQDRVKLAEVRSSFRKSLLMRVNDGGTPMDQEAQRQWLSEGGSPMLIAPELAVPKAGGGNDLFNTCVPVRQPDGVSYQLCHGSIVIAAITSCTNTSNPSVMLAAGLLARNAVQRGLQIKPWVKTSLAPGSKVVTEYLKDTGLMPYLEALRFHLVGYGCTTCIGNSGPLPAHITQAIRDGDLAVASVLSGNRNFEGRVNPLVYANYLASPPLVVAYALAGNLNIDLTRDPLGLDPNGNYVYLKDIMPGRDEVEAMHKDYITPMSFSRSYAEIFRGDSHWNALEAPGGKLYEWNPSSTYIKEPPFFDGIGPEPEPLSDIRDARVLALLGDSITTDHISPAGAIAESSPAGRYLIEQGVAPADFNSYGARRGNHEVMIRGTFANGRLKNRLAPDTQGGVTRYLPGGEQMSIYEAAVKYETQGVPLIVIAGKEYGTGSSRDWAAKGPKLLGVRAVIAESFERIHRSNLIGMGILPLQFPPGQTFEALGLTGTERFDIAGLGSLQPGQYVAVTATSDTGASSRFTVTSRLDSPNEVEYFQNGGILPFVLRHVLH